MSVTLGQIVISKAGRDTGKKFIIIGVIDELYAYVSDGDLRKIEKPKKKKIKHLMLTGDISETVELKLKNNARILNSEIRKALAEYNGTLENK